MKYIPAVAAWALLLLSSAHVRGEWVKIAEQGDKVYYIDAGNKVGPAGGKIKAMSRTVFTGNPKVKEKKAEEEYDCGARSIRTGFVEVTLSTGKVVTQMLDETERPQPGTPGAMKLDVVCEGSGAKGNGK